MATIGALTNYLENSLINHLLRDIPYTSSSSLSISLYTVSPSDIKTIGEVNEEGYMRMAGNFIISGTSASNIQIEFPEATGAWGDIVGVGIMDAFTGGSMLYWGVLDSPIRISTGEIFSISGNMLNIQLKGSTKGGWGAGIPQQILEHTLDNTTFTSPGTSVYLATGSGLIYDTDYTFVSWNETTGTGYSRKQISGINDWASPTNGSTYNLNDVVFSQPPITGDWGRITHIVLFDDPTSGSPLLWGKLLSPIYITGGDGLKFSAGNIDIVLD